MAARYATRTQVNSSDSRAEIERTLLRYGAVGFAYAWEQAKGAEIAVIGFKMKARMIRFRLTMPPRGDFLYTPERGLERSKDAQEAAYEQAVRQRWRALLLVIKAKLEAVEAGIVTLEDEFLAQTMLADGSTVGEWVGPQIDEVYRTGEMPSLLPGVQPKALAAGQQQREGSEG